METLSLSDYRSLAELRYQVRKFLHFSEQAARKARLEPRQHQCLLALKGLPAHLRPTVGVLAERLQIEPHSAVELVNRLVEGGFVERRRAGAGDAGNRPLKDRREVLLSLTAVGQAVLRELSLHHRAELLADGPALMEALATVLRRGQPR